MNDVDRIFARWYRAGKQLSLWSPEMLERAVELHEQTIREMLSLAGLTIEISDELINAEVAQAFGGDRDAQNAPLLLFAGCDARSNPWEWVSPDGQEFMVYIEAGQVAFERHREWCHQLTEGRDA